MAEQEKPVASPCISVCTLDENDICIGCFRSGREIGEWGALDNVRRREVLALAAEREREVNPFL